MRFFRLKQTDRVQISLPFAGRQWSPFDYFRPQRWNWRALLRPLDEGLKRQAAEPLTRLRLVGLRWFWLDGLLSTISENFFVAFVSLFALAYGATNGQIGLLASVTNFLGMAALLPGARAASRWKRRKPIVLWTGGGVARLAILLMAAIPLLAVEPTMMVPLIIGLNGIRAFAGNFGNPAWTAITADLVPGAVRGRYFAGRNIAMAAAALVISPLAGQMVRSLNKGANGVAGYQMVFLLAFIFGMIGTAAFAQIPEHGTRRSSTSRLRRPSIMAVLRKNRAFTGFAASALVWNLALQIAGPFFSPFIVKGLGGDATVVGIAAGCFSLCLILGQKVFGRLVDRRGNLITQRVTGLIIPLIPAAWALVRTPYQIYIVEALAGFFWAGYRLANFNLLLELSPEEDRPGAVALYQAVVFASAVIGPFIGGLLIETFGFRSVFVASAGGRFIGAIMFIVFVPVVRRAKKPGSPSS